MTSSTEVNLSSSIVSPEPTELEQQARIDHLYVSFINGIYFTGVICLMHFQGLSSAEAISVAKSRRPIIEPIGDFKELLAQCDRLRRGRDNRFLM